VKILVTGNMGYVGPAVARHLRAAYPGATLVGLDMGYFATALTNSVILPECQIDVQCFGDVRKPPTKLLAGVSAVVHLAAISNDATATTFESVTFDVNHRATVDLATRARETGVSRFVFASSCSVYGAGEDAPRSEASPVNPLTAYAKSKVLAELDLARLAEPSFTVTSLRFATACGMSERLRLDLVLNDFVASAVASGVIQILSDGSPWRPLIHVSDMARAVAWAIGRDADAGGDFLTINVGSDAANWQVKDIAEAVCQVLPGVRMSIGQQALPDKRSYRVDFGLFRRLAPDHQPRNDLLTTITELASGLRAMGFKDEAFRDSRYIRLNILADLRTRGLLDDALCWVTRDGTAAP
jgi:nucleoside-diphosphate-sugar epimerase